MPAKPYPKWRHPSKFKRVAIGLGAFVLGAAALEGGAQTAKGISISKLRNTAIKFRALEVIADKDPDSAQKKRNFKDAFKRYDSQWVKTVALRRLLPKARPFYLGAGGVIGLLAALGISVAGRKRTLKKLKGKYPESKIITGEMYDSVSLEALIKKGPIEQIEKHLKKTYYAYLSNAMKEYDYYLIIGNTFVLFNEPKK